MNIDISNLDAILFSYFWLDIKSVRTLLEQGILKNAVITEDADIKPLLNLQYGYNTTPMRATFFSVAKNTTIMFSNLQDGWATLYNTIANRLKAKSCYMRIMDCNKIVDASNCFIYCEDSKERIVYTLKEHKWVFYEQGMPLPFENTNYYTAKQKKERLNKKIMVEYCEHLGISKNGIITLNASGAFSYEYGKCANSKGIDSAYFVRK